jgi:hypothetical protein
VNRSDELMLVQLIALHLKSFAEKRPDVLRLMLSLHEGYLHCQTSTLVFRLVVHKRATRIAAFWWQFSMQSLTCVNSPTKQVHGCESA